MLDETLCRLIVEAWLGLVPNAVERQRRCESRPSESSRVNEPADRERPRLVHDNLHKFGAELGAELAAAVAAADRADWEAMLQAVRMIQGRAMVTRGLLERTLGQDAAATEPALVRVIREIKGLISNQEVDSLSPDELRARMRKVLQALDRELKVMLSPPDESSIA
jgi:hypothetical protein